MTDAPVIRTSRFVLRPLTPEDVTEDYVSWLRAEDAGRYIRSARVDQDRSTIGDYISARVGREDVLFLGIFVGADGRHIGNVKFEPIDTAEGWAVMGMLIGDHDWRGKGVAPEVLLACAEWLRAERSVRQIILGVDKDNVAAFRAYRKAGFVEVDSHPAYAPGGETAIMVMELHDA